MPAPALDLLDEGFAVYDDRLSLAACNAPFRERCGYPRELLAAGTPLGELLRFHLDGGASAEANAETLARSRLAALARGEPQVLEHEPRPGATIRVRIQPLPDGGAAVICGDVSRERDVERRLAESEERCAAIAAVAEDGIYEWFIDRDEIYVSPRLDQFFKFEVGELGPKEWNWNDRIHPDDLEHYLTSLAAHLAGDGHRWECEYRFRDKLGEYRWIMDRGHTIRDEGGRALRLAGAVRDITRRKESEEALRRSEARHELAMRAINEGVYDWDIASGRIWYSPRVAIAVGLSPEELSEPEDWIERVHPDDLPGYKRAIVAHFKGETERLECDYRYRGADGSWRWARQHGIALRGEDGRAYRMIGSTGDITELKEHERALAEKTAILETTLENIDQGITMVDADLRCIAFNRRFLELLDFPPERFAPGFHMADAFRYNAERGEYGDGDVEEQVRARVELARRFEPHAFERMRPDGTILAVRGNPVPGGGFVSTYTDVTEQKHTEKALRASEERYALATRAATEGIYEWNIEADTLYLSERAKELLGFPGDSLTPAAWNRRIHPEDYEGYRQALVAHFKGETSRLEHEYRIRDADGRYLWLLDSGIAVRNEAQRAVRMVGAIADITSRKEVVNELRRARDAAEAATRAKSQFLANMSHELRTPLNAIIGFTRLVMRRSKEALEPRQYENLEKILASAEHLLSLINSILDLSKIEAERMDVYRSDFELAPLLEQCLRTVEPLVKHDTVALERDIEADLPVMHTDQEKLRQIVINLLSNAAKFTERGSIRLGARRCDAGNVAIDVADTGSGIAEENLELVFEEFSQVDSSSTRQHGGTGLGLSIGRRLARLLGGDIHVRSVAGQGSTFTVTLPVRDAAETARGQSRPVSSAGEAEL